MNRSRLFFLFLLVSMVFVALAPGAVTGFQGTGENHHVFAFMVLPLVSAIAWPRFPLLYQFIGYSALGASIEGVQALLHDWHRAEWSDWFTDVGTTAVALLVVAGVRWWMRRRLARP